MRTGWWCVPALLAAILSGCSQRDEKRNPVEPSDKVPTTGQKELLIYVGAGIRPPVAELAEIFGQEHHTKIVADYAGSEVLISKIRLLQRGDVYMPGDKPYVDQAAQAGMISSQESVCYFVPTILVRKGNPKGIRGVADLVKTELKLGLGDEKACAIGPVSRKIFEKNKIPWTEVEKNLKFQAVTVNELGLHIQAGSLDAVIVWDAIAMYYAEHGDAVPIPKEANVISTVDAGILAFSRNREGAAKFVAFMRSDRGREIFKKHNYRVDPPE